MKHKRKIRNFLLMPKIQLRYLYYLLALNVAPMAVLLAFGVIQFQRLRIELATFDQLPTSLLVSIDTTMSHLALGFLIAFLSVLLLLIYGSIVISHRFVGPMYVINRQLKSLIKGDYEVQRNLRKHDEMKETFELIKELAQKLRSSQK